MKKEVHFDGIGHQEAMDHIAHEHGIVTSTNTGNLVITDHINKIKNMALIIDFVESVKKCKRAFFSSESILSKDRFMKSAMQIYKWFPEVTTSDEPGFFYGPEINAFFRVVDRLGIRGLELHSKACPVGNGESIMNELIKELKKELHSSRYKVELRAELKASKRRYRSAVKYLMSLLGLHAKILPVSIDRHYLGEWSKRFDESDARRHREMFIEELSKHQELSCMVGYIIKIEEGKVKGIHSHDTYFFDGSKHKNAAYLADKIGSLWRSMMGRERAYYFNCHLNPSRYRHRCVGMLEYSDGKSIDNMIQSIAYQTKPDRFLQSRRSAKGNLFTRGKIRRPSVKRHGRPRRKNGAFDSRSI